MHNNFDEMKRIAWGREHKAEGGMMGRDLRPMDSMKGKTMPKVTIPAAKGPEELYKKKGGMCHKKDR